MKTLGFIASTALLFALSGTANAEQFTSKKDPTGVDMCFDSAGEKAPLASCSTATTSYVTRADPTGVAMCFDSTGAKAPLDACTSAPVATKAIKPTLGVIVQLASLR